MHKECGNSYAQLDQMSKALRHNSEHSLTLLPVGLH